MTKFAFGGVEILLLLVVGVVGLVLLVAGTIFMVWYLRRNKHGALPSVPTPASPGGTAAVKQCPRCHRMCGPNDPEGLCPGCLAKAALETEPAAPAATAKVNPLVAGILAIIVRAKNLQIAHPFGLQLN